MSKCDRGRVPRWFRRAGFGLLVAAAAAPGAAFAGPPAPAAPKVVTSVMPLHSLVAGVMAGIGEPYLLIKGAGSPHGYSLRPAEARALSQADLVIWVGESLETALLKPLAALARAARVLELTDTPGIEVLPLRAGGAWDMPTHEAGTGEARGQADQAHDETAEAAHDRGRGGLDPHLWLDPRNAAAIVRSAVAALSEMDPGNAPRYRANGERVIARLEALEPEIAETLRPVRDVPYIVFHDAYHYFERRFATRAVGSIALGPERAPGARRLHEIRERIGEVGAACVFAEPQFEPALVETVAKGTAARTNVLDPLGADLTPGPEAYFTLLRRLADSLASCLSAAG